MLATLERPSLSWRRARKRDMHTQAAVACMSFFHRLMTAKLTAPDYNTPFPDSYPSTRSRNHVWTGHPFKPHQLLLPRIRSEVYLTSYLIQLEWLSCDCLGNSPRISAESLFPRLLPSCPWRALAWLKILDFWWSFHFSVQLLDSGCTYPVTISAHHFPKLFLPFFF